MDSQSLLNLITDGNDKVPENWISPTKLRPFFFDDPGLIWLKYHGDKYDLVPDELPYSFLDFIGNKGREFEDKWIQEITPAAVNVCENTYEVRSSDYMVKTLNLMTEGTPVIAQPALWWAPERIYGVPDLIILSTWLKSNFPTLVSGEDLDETASNLSLDTGYYIVFDHKFTSKLENSSKKNDLLNYQAQVRIYSYMLGHIQGFMPSNAYLITRDRIVNPHPVNIHSELGDPLDEDLKELRDQFFDIKFNGSDYVPWEDDLVAINLSNEDETWSTAKKIIAKDKTPGKDSGLIYQIGNQKKEGLKHLGYENIEMMLAQDPEDIPLEDCDGLGPTYSKRIRSILLANKTGSAIIPNSEEIPEAKEYEFFIDYEYLTNVNVDFENQWPGLEGCEMIFMIGVGWEASGQWKFKTFIAEQEEQSEELIILEDFLQFLDEQTGADFLNKTQTALYHWSYAEKSQTKRAIDRHELPESHPLQNLPWFDLQNIFHKGPIGLPGAWGYGLKEVAKSLSEMDRQYDPEWPGDLDKGLSAMVMGWESYKAAIPKESKEMNILENYLEADCKALWNILRWLRYNKNE